MGIIIRIRSKTAISLVLILAISLLVTPLTALGVVSTANSSVLNLPASPLTVGQPASFQATVMDVYNASVAGLVYSDFTYYLGNSGPLNVSAANPTGPGVYGITFTPATTTAAVYLAVYAQNIPIGGFPGVAINAAGAGVASNKAITNFGIAVPGVPMPMPGMINEATGAISVTVPPGTVLTNLVAAFVSTGTGVTVGAVVQTSGQTPNDFTTAKTYRVTAQDGSTKDYVVTVTVGQSGQIQTNDTLAFTSFQIPALAPMGFGMISQTSPWTIMVPANLMADKTALVAKFTVPTSATVSVIDTAHPNGVAQTSEVTSNNFTNPVTYRVTNGGQTRDYVVTLQAGGSSQIDTTGATSMTDQEKVNTVFANLMIPGLGIAASPIAYIGGGIPLPKGALADVTWAVTTGTGICSIGDNPNSAETFFTKVATPSAAGTVTLRATITSGSVSTTKDFTFTVQEAPAGVTTTLMNSLNNIGSQLSVVAANQIATQMQTGWTALTSALTGAANMTAIANAVDLQAENLALIAQRAQGSGAATFMPELVTQTQTMFNTLNTSALTQMGRGASANTTDLTAGTNMINNLIQQSIITGGMTMANITGDLQTNLASSIMKIIDTAGTCKPSSTAIAAADLTSAINEVNTQFTSFNSQLNTLGGASVIGTTAIPVERRVNLFVPTSSNVVTLDSSAINTVIGQAANNMKLAVTKQVTVGATTVPVAAKIPASLLQSLSSTIGDSLSVEIAPSATLTAPATATNASSVFSFKMNNGTVSDFTYDPVTVEMPYSGSGTTLKAYYYNTSNSTWTPVTNANGPVTVTKTADGTVTFDTTHFTDFMVAEAIIPSSSSSSSGGGSGSATTTAATPSVTATLGTPVSVTATSGASISGSGVSIAIPAGAVASDIKVTITKVADTAALSVPSTSQLVSDVLEIVKDKSGDFSKAVTISLNFDKSKVDTSKVDVAVCFFDESKKAWVKLDNIKLDASSGKVSGDVTHFTKFAVLTFPKAATTPAEPTSVATPTTPAISGLTDIAGHWAQAGIANLVAKGIIKGYPDGSFKPNNAITRAEFAVILVKALGGSPQAGKTFNDTAAHWAKDYISTAVAMGIVSGYSSTQFAPDEQITREQMAQMVVNAAKLAKSSAKLTFKDAAGVSSWAKAAVASISAAGIMSGYPDSTFKAKAKATRAEAVTVVVKIIK